MQSKNWISNSGYIDNTQDLRRILINNRGLDEEITTTSLKDIISNPFEHGFEKDQVNKASEIIKEIKSAGKGVLLHGDYDGDGITSIALLHDFFKNIGFSEDVIETFLPNRFRHGYGFSDKSFEELSKKYSSEEYPLLILADCGINAVENIKKAKKEGYKVIVIDHHQKKPERPAADLVFWNDKLTTSILAYLFSKYLEIKVSNTTVLSEGVDLAGIGYVTDLGDLSYKTGNIVVKEGLNSINSSPRKGIEQLIESSGLKDKKIGSYHIGWVIGPRLNSSGRMTDPNDSLKLLLGKDSLGVAAQNLEDINTKRQNKTKEMFEVALSGLSNGKFVGVQESHKTSIVHSEEFHEGVIGLIASKIVNNLNKPSICISWDEDNDLGKGSCRSIEGFNIVKALNHASDYLEDFGGHTMAAGFSIKRSNYENFESSLLDYASEKITDEMLIPKIKYDADIPEELLTRDLLDFIDRLEPFGNGNPKPKFVLNNTQIKDIETVGKDNNHLKFKLEKSGIHSIYFRFGDLKEKLDPSAYYDILFCFEKNIWKGSVYPQLIIKGLRLAEDF